MRRDVRRLIDLHGCEVVAAALAPFVTETRQVRIEQVLDARLEGLSIAFENLHDPHNGAAAVRSMEAFGLCDVHAAEPVEPFRTSRAITIGCEQWISVHRYPTMDAMADVLHSNGMVLCATLPDATMSIEELDHSKPRVLLFGNEHEGLTERAIELCDEAVTIPMYGFTQSFNLSVSVALMCERASACRRAAVGSLGDLEENRRNRLRAEWYSVGVRGAAEIIQRHVSKTTP